MLDTPPLFRHTSTLSTPQAGFRVGVDLGGTKTEAVLLDDSLSVLKRERVATPSGQDGDATYERIIKTITRLASRVSGGVNDFTLGVCTPGVTSDCTGAIKNSNTQCLIGRPLKEDLERALGREILMDNDANCFAVAEARMGSAADFIAGDTCTTIHGCKNKAQQKEPRVVFGVIMGTGVGGGIIIDNKIYHGRTQIGGEWGHHTLHQNGNPCYCGRSGCVETYISGPALERRWQKLSGRTDTLSVIVHKGAACGDVWNEWKDEFVENFGRGLANVIDILDPTVIVLGGGLSNIDFLYTDGKKSVHDKVFSDHIDTPILQNGLGDSAGVIGACLLCD